jgi:hypothetical protein
VRTLQLFAPRRDAGAIVFDFGGGHAVFDRLDNVFALLGDPRTHNIVQAVWAFHDNQTRAEGCAANRLAAQRCVALLVGRRRVSNAQCEQFNGGDPKYQQRERYRIVFKPNTHDVCTLPDQLIASNPCIGRTQMV